jgi:uncharacterized protein (TIGR00661 family)
MRILFAIQGTGNGHISRAREIIPLLQQYGHLDILISGTQADVLPDQPLAYNFHGFSFVFGKHGGVDHWKTYKAMNLPRLWRDIRSLPLKDYDLIINDFEPVTAWACKLQGRPSVALSHQSSFLSEKTPRPSNRFHWAELIFRYYAPSTYKIGFHFERYDDFIHTPVIRSEIRNRETKDLGHVTVYLPAYDDKILVGYLKQIKEMKWEVFTKHSKSAYQEANISVRPINNAEFNTSLANSSGLLTGGGFEGPAEALFLKKKVIVFPMKDQYEQVCNAEAARRLGVPVIHRLDDNFIGHLKNWLNSPNTPKVDFPDETASIIDNMVKTYSGI